MTRMALRALLAVVAALATMLATTMPAQAADPSQNIGWLYTTDSGPGGGAYFDADSNGWPNYEKLTVCDNKPNGMGVIAYVWAYGTNSSYYVVDPSDDHVCNDINFDMWSEGTLVEMQVCEYAAGTYDYYCSLADTGAA